MASNSQTTASKSKRDVDLASVQQFVQSICNRFSWKMLSSEVSIFCLVDTNPLLIEESMFRPSHTCQMRRFYMGWTSKCALINWVEMTWKTAEDELLHLWGMASHVWQVWTCSVKSLCMAGYQQMLQMVSRIELLASFIMWFVVVR